MSWRRETRCWWAVNQHQRLVIMILCYQVGLVGDAQIGKTSLMVKYVEGSFDEDYIQTLGVVQICNEHHNQNPALFLHEIYPASPTHLKHCKYFVQKGFV